MNNSDKLLKKLNKKADKKFKIFSRLKLDENMKVVEDYTIKQKKITGWGDIDYRLSSSFASNKFYENIESAKSKLKHVKENYVRRTFYNKLNLVKKDIQ